MNLMVQVNFFKARVTHLGILVVRVWDECYCFKSVMEDGVRTEDNELYNTHEEADTCFFIINT